MITERLSLKIKILSAVALFMVILQHASSGVEKVGMGCVWRGAISHGIAEYPVSFFFILSGSFLALHHGVGWYKRAVLKRVKSLILPYFLWCMIGWGVVSQFQGRLFLDVLGVTHHVPILDSLWYVKILFILVLLSPLFVWTINMAHMKTKALFGVWGCVYVAVATICLLYNVSGQKTMVFSTLYFVLGLLIGNTVKGHGEEKNDVECLLIPARNISNRMLLLLVVCLCVVGGMNVISIHVWNVSETFLRWFIVPICIVFTWVVYDVVDRRINIMALMEGRHWVKMILSGTFFVYCSQDLIMKIFISGIPGIEIHGVGWPLTPWTACCLAMAVSICAVILLTVCSVFLPHCYLFLSGGRK